ncbi:MAG TPA: hypothetical protein VNO83_01450 [Pseudonocardia sp.]|nr:hypothetical protein [Pseudonocardia sp.]
MQLLLPLSINAAPLVAGALLILLTLSVMVVRRRRLVDDRDQDGDLTPGPARVSTDSEGKAAPDQASRAPSAQVAVPVETAVHTDPHTPWKRGSPPPRRRLDPKWEELEEAWAGPDPDGVPAAATAIPAQRTGLATSAPPEAAVGAPEPNLHERLVAVLLADHEAAVGALNELGACQQRLASLAESTSRANTALDEILARLAGTGLRPEQLARLADIPTDEVRRRLPA